MSSWLSVPVRLAALLLLAAISVWETRLAVVTAFLCLVAFLSLPPLHGGQKARAVAALAISGALATLGFFRFVLEEAIPGVVAGGRAAAEKHAVAYLRTIVAAQDHMRRQGYIDPDADGVGSAASLGELTGRTPLRSGPTLTPAPLPVPDEQWSENAFVANGAYFYRVCLPQAEGFADASDPAVAVDDERAEREYLIYAWPKTFGSGSPTDIYVSDAYERIELLDQANAPAELTDRYFGPNAPPPCDLLSQTSFWKAWKSKQPRASLPGDPS